jgi:hypothetical protein
MDLAFIVLAAAEAAEEHHRSEAPFFIAGGILVAFAVAITALGLTRPDFPNTNGAARGVMALSTVLVLAAMSMAVYVAS